MKEETKQRILAKTETLVYGGLVPLAYILVISVLTGLGSLLLCVLAGKPIFVSICLSYAIAGFLSFILGSFLINCLNHSHNRQLDEQEKILIVEEVLKRSSQNARKTKRRKH